MFKRATINSDIYIDTLKKLKARVRPALEMSKVLLQHDNARPHTSFKTCEVISSFGWTTILHPSYLPNRAPSDFHFFKPLKESLRGNISPVMKRSKLLLGSGLKTQPVEFYNEGIYALVKRWEKAVRKAGDYIKK